MAYTLGPWNVEHATGTLFAEYDVKTDNGIYICRVSCVIDPGGSRGPAKSNAALIAAAPDMLVEGLALANEVRAALTLLNETTAGEPLGWTNIACLKRHLDKMDVAIAKAKGE